MPTKNHINIELYLAVIATIIALVSVAVAVWDGIETRTHNRLSVKPILTISKTFNITQTADNKNKQTTMKLSLINRGLGPAVIRDLAIYTKTSSKPFTNWQAALKSINYKGQLHTSADLDIGSVIEAGDTFTLLSIDWQSHEADNLTLELSYESMYEERFELGSEPIFSAK